MGTEGIRRSAVRAAGREAVRAAADGRVQHGGRGRAGSIGSPSHQPCARVVYGRLTVALAVGGGGGVCVRLCVCGGGGLYTKRRPGSHVRACGSGAMEKVRGAERAGMRAAPVGRPEDGRDAGSEVCVGGEGDVHRGADEREKDAQHRKAAVASNREIEASNGRRGIAGWQVVREAVARHKPE
jgi:hypothetical protein